MFCRQTLQKPFHTLISGVQAIDCFIFLVFIFYWYKVDVLFFFLLFLFCFQCACTYVLRCTHVPVCMYMRIYAECSVYFVFRHLFFHHFSLTPSWFGTENISDSEDVDLNVSLYGWVQLFGREPISVDIGSDNILIELRTNIHWSFCKYIVCVYACTEVN